MLFRINKNDERKCDKSSDSKKKRTPECKEYGDQTSNSSLDKIKQDYSELETTSNNYKYIKKIKLNYFNSKFLNSVTLKHSASQ